MADDDAVVSYSVKQLFERIDERLVRMDAKLDAKADKADLDALAVEVEVLRSSWKTFRDRAIGLGIGVAIPAGGMAGVLSRVLVG